MGPPVLGGGPSRGTTSAIWRMSPGAASPHAESVHDDQQLLGVIRMTTSQHRPREPRLARGSWLWRALRCAARAIRDIHNEQVYLWERLYLANRALVPQAGPLAWIPTLDGYRLADLASQPAGSRPRVSYPGQFRHGARPRTTEETMRHGCQDTARADTADWE